MKPPRHITTLDLRPTPRDYPDDNPFLVAFVGTLLIGGLLILAACAAVVS